MRDDFLVSEIELDQVIIALPALVPEAVVVRGISVEADIEPILIGGFPSSLQDILELRESAADMVEHSVQDHADPRCVEVFTDFLEILVGAQPAVDLFIVPRVITVRIRLKYGTKIDCGDPQFCKMRDPFLYFQDPVRLHAVVFIGRSAHAQRVNLIDHTFFCPHNKSSLS